MSFSNSKLDVATLPRFETLELERLSPKYAPLVLAVSLVVWTFVVLAILIVSALIDPLRDAVFSQRAVPFVVIGACGVTFLVWFGWKSVSVIRYAVREHDVIVRTGVFWRKETIQPLVRIQHVEQSQGPLEKRFGLYRLKLFSAGTGHVTFQIPGLSARTAARLRRFLLERTGANSEADEADA